MRDGDGSGQHEFLISTARLGMRPRLAADAIVLNALADNPAIALNLGATIAPDRGETLTIIDRASDSLVGLARSGATGLGSGIEAALWIGEPYWSQGYGTEAAQALIDYTFRDPRTTMLWCSNRVTNARARRVIEKCGFQFRGGGMVRLPGRGAFPIERFALDRKSWESLKSWGARDPAACHAARFGEAPCESAA